MASQTRNLALAILIRAQDTASAVFGSLAAKVTALLGALGAFVGIKFLEGATQEAASFDDAMSRVIVKTDDGKQHTAELRAAAEGIAASYNKGATEGAQALEILGAAGLKAKDAIATLPAVLSLARSEDIGLAQAADLVVTAVNTMGIGFQNASHAVDVMTKAGLESTTTANEVGTAISYAGAQAKASGLSFEQTAAAIAIMAENGVKGERAGTALREILTMLMDPSQKARQELAALGDVSGTLSGALNTIANSGARGEQVILAFGQEAGPGLRALLASGTSGLATMTTALQQSDGVTSDVAKNVDVNKQAWEGLTAAWDTVKRYLTTPLLEPIRKGVADLTEALKTAVSDGSLNNFRDGIVTAFNEGVKAVKDFLASFNYEEALARLQQFAGDAITAMQNLGDIGGKVAAALSAAWNGFVTTVSAVLSVFETVVSSFLSGLAQLTAGLEKLGVVAKGTAAALEQSAEAWSKSAAQWGDTSVRALDNTAAALDRLTTSVSGTAKAVDNLGLDLSESAKMAVELSSETAVAAAATKDFDQAMDDAKPKLDAASKSADAHAEAVKALRARYEELRASGTATPQELGEALVALQKEMGKTQAAADTMSKEVVAAYQRLGIQSEQALKTLADQAEKDFQTIRNAGADVGTINAAFEAMAKKMLDAANAGSMVEQEIVRIKLQSMAANDAQVAALQKLEQSYQDAGQAAQAAGVVEVRAANDAADALRAQTQAIVDQITEEQKSAAAAQNAANQAFHDTAATFTLPDMEEFAKQLAMGTAWAKQMETWISNLQGFGDWLEIARAKAKAYREEFDQLLQQAKANPNVPAPTSSQPAPTTTSPAPVTTPSPAPTASPAPSAASQASAVTLTARVIFSLPEGDVPMVTDEVSLQRLLKTLKSSKLASA
jgi:TP901 family phage tail tape measure protein